MTKKTEADLEDLKARMSALEAAVEELLAGWQTQVVDVPVRRSKRSARVNGHTPDA